MDLSTAKADKLRTCLAHYRSKFYHFLYHTMIWSCSLASPLWQHFKVQSMCTNQRVIAINSNPHLFLAGQEPLRTDHYRSSVCVTLWTLKRMDWRWKAHILMLRTNTPDLLRFLLTSFQICKLPGCFFSSRWSCWPLASFMPWILKQQVYRARNPPQRYRRNC